MTALATGLNTQAPGLSLPKVIWFIILSRASLDLMFQMVKENSGLSIGPGFLFNMLVVVLGIALVVKREGLLPKYAIVSWWGFMALCIFGIIMAPVKMDAIRTFLALSTYFFMFVIPFYMVRNNDDFMAMIKMFFMASIIPVVMGVRQAIFGVNEGSIALAGRVYGSFTHPNIFAFYLAFILMVLMYLHFTNQLTRVLSYRTAVVYGGVSFLLLMLTETRSAWLGVLVFGLIYGAMVERRYIIYIGVLGAIALLIPSIQDRVFDLFKGNDVNNMMYGEALNSYAWRKILWADAMVEVAHKPLLGWGLGAFSYYCPTFFSLDEITNWDAHNVFVQILFETGWIGLLSFIWLMLYILIDLMSFSMHMPYKGRVCLIAMLLAYCLTSYSDNILEYLTYNWYFWFFIGSFLSCKFHMEAEAESTAFKNMITRKHYNRR